MYSSVLAVPYSLWRVLVLCYRELRKGKRKAPSGTSVSLPTAENYLRTSVEGALVPFQCSEFSARGMARALLLAYKLVQIILQYVHYILNTYPLLPVTGV